MSDVMRTMPTPTPSKSVALILVLYLLCGVGIGAGPFQSMAAQWLGRAGLGTFFVVNVLVPVVAIMLGAIHVRIGAAAVGGLLLAIGLVLGGMFRAQPNPTLWSGALALQMSHPILVVAALGNAMLGAGSAWASRSIRDAFHRRASNRSTTMTF